MSCLAIHDLSLCGNHQFCRQHHIWLGACRRHTAVSSLSIKKQRFSQQQTAPGKYCHATAAHPQQQQVTLVKPDLPDISELSPQLQQEWHPDNNALLGGIKVTPGSSLKVMWTCPKCPAGRPHIWMTAVYNRTRGTKCPFCQGRSVCQHNSLATKAPRQTQYWNHDKNAKTPEQTLMGSKLRAEWKCPTCSFEWQAPVTTRAKYDSGCPRCSKAQARRATRPTFAAVQHQLLHQWDYEHNSEDGIYPHDTTLGSKKRVHWVCHNCPKGKLHLYQMTPNDRTNRQRAGCPYCAGRQVCKCNSLQAHYPMVSSEWDFAKNDLTPSQVTSRSDQLVWWENSVRGSWVQRINERTDLRLNPE